MFHFFVFNEFNSFSHSFKAKNMKQKLLMLCLCLVTTVLNAQVATSVSLLPPHDSITEYSVINMQGQTIQKGTAQTLSFNVPDGVYIMYPTRQLVVVVNGYVVAYRSKDSFGQQNKDQKCAGLFGPERPYYDSASLLNYIHERIDHLSSVEEKAIELTRFATEAYPLSGHGIWVKESWMYDFSQIVNHFLQTDSMGMCGDQATFLGNFMYRLLGVRSCAISITMNPDVGVDTAGNGHVQLLAEIPNNNGGFTWAIFDSQNGVVYRDSSGALADFRALMYRMAQPVAYELAPIGSVYDQWTCTNSENAWAFPFETMQVYYRSDIASNGIDTVLNQGERRLSFIMQPQFWGPEYKDIAQSYGFKTQQLTPKQLSDILPLLTAGIYETTHYGPTGISANLEFAAEVRQSLGLQWLKWSDYPAKARARKYENLIMKR